MVRKRKIIVYIAASADGFIARTDGSVDWLDRPRPKGNYGMGAFYKIDRHDLVGQEDMRYGARLSKERRVRVGLRYKR
jgi:dihydrofolate reductase